MDEELFHSLITAPDEPFPWDRLTPLSWWRAMAECPQDPLHHGEGDVATHTRMVVDELSHLCAWRDLPPAERGVLLLAALLHDVGKPATTIADDDGRITSPGHSRRGMIQTREMLWRVGIPFPLREAVCALIRWHQRPFFVIGSDDPERAVITIAQTCRCDHLAILAEADVRGRIAPTQDTTLLHVALFAEVAREAGCLTAPYPFASAHSRFEYFRKPGRTASYEAFDDTSGEIIMMSGLPGMGKDTLARREFAHLPMISLDALRTEMRVSHTDNQHGVISAAREQARVYLRRGEPFVWNATTVSREQREPIIALATEYNFRVRIAYVEVPWHAQQRQNKSRPEQVPDAAILRMMHRWEIPDEAEAHTVEFHVSHG
ncbi:MAG: AAA family ATPase [Akkermansiaceae bacterium]|nr:AAA family ATPase [Armatimonadota bacterium]